MSAAPRTVAASLVREATAMADAADARGGIQTRPAEPGELDGVMGRFASIWGEGRGMDRATLQAIDHAGNTVLVAVPAASLPPGDEPALGAARDAGGLPAAPDPALPLGATLGFLGWSGGLHMHSHMNAVDAAARGRGIGVALKLRQRALCLAHGITEMRWTYDPLIRRNARMNLVRLGAEVIAFHPDFYGELRDAITGADRSDRFEVRWRLDSPRTLRALARGPLPAWSSEGGLRLVADFEALRVSDPDAAARLRDASREALAALAEGSGLRAELDENGDYVFTRDDPDREA